MVYETFSNLLMKNWEKREVNTRDEIDFQNKWITLCIEPRG